MSSDDDGLTTRFDRDEFETALAALAFRPPRRLPPIDWVLGERAPEPEPEPPTEVVASYPRETMYADEATTIVDWSEERIVRAEREGRRKRI
jgi:hypothetical protein